MAKSPSEQRQAWLEATGLAQDTAGGSSPDYGNVSFTDPSPEAVIFDRKDAFKVGRADQVQLLGYYVPTREMRDLSPWVEQVSYTEAEGQAGVQGSLTFMDLSKPGALSDWRQRNSLRTFIAQVGMVMIYSTGARGRPVRERQRWINWNPTVGGRGQDTLSFYDYLVYLNGQGSFGYSKDRHHKGGWTASEITADICRRYSIPTKSIVAATYKIPYFMFTGSIYEAIATAYAFERHMTGKYFYITTDRGQLVVRRNQSILHDPKLVFLLDPSSNVREPLTFSRSLDQYAGGIIPTGTDIAGNPAYIASGNADPNQPVYPNLSKKDLAAAGLTQGQANAASTGRSKINATLRRNQLAAGLLFGDITYDAKLHEIRDPAYTQKAAQLLSNRLARAAKDLQATVDGNVLVRQGSRVHVLGYPLDLYVRSVSQTITAGDHTMALSMAWREFEVSDMADYHSVQQAGAQYAQALNQQSSLGKVGGSGTSAGKGGWVRIGATIDPTRGQAPTYDDHNGMSFAELLQAGNNRGLHPTLTETLGLTGGQYGMPMETPLLVRMPGAGTQFKVWKNDVGSGQAGNAHFKMDLHQGIANALGWTPNSDVEVKPA